ncbi:dihydrofolate reductase family protein [Bogoriella caseilytica]|uniref:Dihydrofolate reductase n=1 Tax=Bogoriella caseilytica TaxID=56055 RepID=A0A3N2BC37_9MICO|nr:dihydrofolate reductase family protein [Bogoriella caseilytica]ROR72810.1 dihydrofolate reductase [Bogoriella caseilytica]
MSSVAADISMSLDGYVTGPEPDGERGLGIDGEALHGWVLNSEDSPPDRHFLEMAEHHGAVIMGRRTFDFVDGPHGWNDDIGYAYDHDLPSRPPVFVVTHEAPETTRLAGFTFVTDGIAAAIEAARATAGERETVIMGGASVIDQALTAGLVDELRIHLSPVVMGNGTRLFDLIDERVLLNQHDVVVTDHATHLTYRTREL